MPSGSGCPAHALKRTPIKGNVRNRLLLLKVVGKAGISNQHVLQTASIFGIASRPGFYNRNVLQITSILRTAIKRTPVIGNVGNGLLFLRMIRKRTLNIGNVRKIVIDTIMGSYIGKQKEKDMITRGWAPRRHPTMYPGGDK